MTKLSRASAAAAMILAVAASASAFTFPAATFPAARPAPDGTAAARRTAAAGPMQPGGPLRHTEAGMHAMMNAITVTSTNWAGYAASGKDDRFRYIRATFFVPYVDCRSTPDSFSSHWIGLDGFASPTVEQTGVLAACDGTKPVYQAWYEMFPRLPVYPDIKIRPGQAIVASVFRQSGTGRFTIRLADTTNGHHFTRILSCPSRVRCRRASAEVISEAPSTGSTILPLSDFRAENFGGVKVTDQAGHHSRLRSARWDTFKITNVSRGNKRVMDQPTALFRGGTFGSYWMRAK
ncbi:MAG: hypothetical protein J2P35_12635 [Actinobacteria bacterium]|nr:hypothetical protein [Actinomycetota bacterium]MBO0785149.1 hypothetical protein [Actinomycetota bacterium]